jgi:acetyl esterase/lipase
MSLFTLGSGALQAAPKPDAVIPYKTTEQGELSLYVFYPDHQKPDQPTPAIVFFFGGGWVSGGPSQFYPQCEYLASRGMVAIAADYRTKQGHGTSPQECVKDGKSAIRWIRAHAAELGIDPDKLAAGGGSAGGHVAAATALVDDYNDDSDDLSVSCVPDALVLFNPVIDNGPNGYGYDRVQAYWETFSPMNNIDADAPPTVVFLGTKDHLIPVATAEEYQRLMQKNGVRCDLHLYEGQGHGFFNYGKGNSYTLTMIEADKFLASLGYLQGEPSLHSPSGE